MALAEFARRRILAAEERTGLRGRRIPEKEPAENLDRVGDVDLVVVVRVGGVRAARGRSSLEEIERLR